METLEYRFNNKQKYIDEGYYTYVEQLENKLKNNRKNKRFLNCSNFEGRILKELRSIVYEIVKNTEFEKQLECVKAFNEFFGSGGDFWRDNNNSEKFCQAQELFSPIETNIRLLKYLQGGEFPSEEMNHRREEIADDFSVSKNTIDDYMRKLQYEGVNILGSNVKIEEIRRGINNYDSTIHPVFLALNLSEVYMLTVLLKQKCGSDVNELVADIYRQLSPYAKDKIDSFAERDGVDLFDGNTYEDYDKGYRSEEKTDVRTLLKTGERCEICFTSEIPKTHLGKIKNGNQGFIFVEDKTGRKYDLNNEMISSIKLAK
ncbi:MAG: hypothetical protein IKF29_00145 [Oceanobacillus sp.]|nr:hypothetical protein [Oceanobacillus sp.]